MAKQKKVSKRAPNANQPARRAERLSMAKDAMRPSRWPSAPESSRALKKAKSPKAATPPPPKHRYETRLKLKILASHCPPKPSPPLACDAVSRLLAEMDEMEVELNRPDTPLFLPASPSPTIASDTNPNDTPTTPPRAGSDAPTTPPRAGHLVKQDQDSPILCLTPGRKEAPIPVGFGNSPGSSLSRAIHIVESPGGPCNPIVLDSPSPPRVRALVKLATACATAVVPVAGPSIIPTNAPSKEIGPKRTSLLLPAPAITSFKRQRRLPPVPANRTPNFVIHPTLPYNDSPTPSPERPTVYSSPLADDEFDVASSSDHSLDDEMVICANHDAMSDISSASSRQRSPLNEADELTDINLTDEENAVNQSLQSSYEDEEGTPRDVAMAAEDDTGSWCSDDELGYPEHPPTSPVQGSV
ncbi:hypothetical protein CVT24_007878 [Panaeolus cyanescens]|uniref:Uncharacterized protein n=1 Tax=Panaeolus cyanescens TaxID=181874 RepID=A0A409WRK1_9AGAR|nr:hypothetical protein CVT24_007878 [Panaeolus cyanescens]